MNHNTIPVYPREKMDIPNWMNYEVNGDIAKNIKKRMRGCEREGIWDLVWEQSTKSKDREEGKGRKRRRRARDEESDEDDDEQEGRKRVSERGWVVLEWLVHIWEKDQEERGGEFYFLLACPSSRSVSYPSTRPRSSEPSETEWEDDSGAGLIPDYSPAFLAQLPKQGEMQIDNPTSPLQVLYSVLNPIEDQTDESGESEERGTQADVGKEEQDRRERTAGRIISLVSPNTSYAQPSHTDLRGNRTDGSYSIPPILSYPHRNPHSTPQHSHSRSSPYSAYHHPNSKTSSVSSLPPLPGGRVISPTS
jgi:hypothetical protein